MAAKDKRDREESELQSSELFDDEDPSKRRRGPQVSIKQQAEEAIAKAQEAAGKAKVVPSATGAQSSS